MNGNKVYLKTEEVINIVAGFYELPVENVICTKRKREWIKAKHIAMYFCRLFTPLSLAAIGERFNGKDHATVLHAIESVEGQKDIYRAYRTELNEILRRLKTREDLEFEKYKMYNTECV